MASLISTTSAHRTPPSTSSFVRRAAGFVRPYRLLVAGIVGIALVIAVLGAVDPLVMKYLFDGLAAGAPRPLALGLVALLGIELGRSLLGGWLATLTWDVRLGVDFDLRERLLAKLCALPVDYHTSEGVGGTMNKVNQSVTAFVTAFGQLAFNVLPTLVYLLLSIVAMVQLEWRLAVAVLVFTPMPALIGAWAAREQTERERVLMDMWTKIYSRLNEVLAGIRTVKVFAMEETERARFLEAQAEGNRIVRRGVTNDTRTGALRGLAATLARLAAISLGGWLILHGRITVGTLMAFLGYVTGLFGPVQGLTDTYQTMRKANVALELIFEIFDADEVVADRADAVDAGRFEGEIRFHDVSFSHGDGPRVLHDFNMHVRPGETVALVGPSGSGKSTMTSLLLRLNKLDAGRITIDGTDIRDLTAHSLRRQIGFVSQEIHLFNDTVRANIAYGRPDATDRDVREAALAAHAHEFIATLPAEYDTVIGERGSRLSGGQRQRLAIARALLMDASILVLDEATSALDTVSEAIVQETLEDLCATRTTLVIAHRLSTVVNADRIVVLHDGRVLAQGTHEQLLQTCTYYAALVGASTNGLLAVA